MESPSCTILNTTQLCLKSTISITHSNNLNTHFSSLPRNPLTPFRFTFSGKSNFPGKCLQLNCFTSFCLPSGQDYLNDENPSQQLAVLLEVEGVLVDAYRVGNRQAFNTAFRKLGLDCANWSEPVYLDLVRKSVGDQERMLILYFNRIGWPTSLPTSEKGSFIKSVIKEKGNALDEFLVSKSLPLRPGVEEFIDNAYNEGVPVVILTSYSKNADKIARSVTEKLGDERASKVKIIGNEEVEQSLYGRLLFHKGFSSGLDEQLAKEVKKAVSAEKQRIAEKVASTLKVSVKIDTSPSESSTSRAEFPSAKAVMDGFGGADLTISKLRQKTRD